MSCRAVHSSEGGGGFLLFPLADSGWVNNRLSPLGQMGLSLVPGRLSPTVVALKTPKAVHINCTQTHISLQAANIFYSALMCSEV